MLVKILNNTYRMPNKKFYELVKIAKENVKFGIYAVVKQDGSYAELYKLECKSKTQLKRLKRDFKSKGYKVLANG